MSDYHLDELVLNKVWLSWLTTMGYDVFIDGPFNVFADANSELVRQFEHWLRMKGIIILEQNDSWFLEFFDKDTCVWFHLKYT